MIFVAARASMAARFCVCGVFECLFFGGTCKPSTWRIGGSRHSAVKALLTRKLEALLFAMLFRLNPNSPRTGSLWKFAHMCEKRREC